MLAPADVLTQTVRPMRIALFAALIGGIAFIPIDPRGDVAGAASIPPRATIGKVRWAYYVPYAANSLSSLREYVSALDYVSPYWYRIDGEGNLISSGDGEINERNRQTVLDLAGTHGVRVLPMIKNRETYADFTPVLADPAVRAAAIENIARMTLDGGFAGAHIDFEGISPEDRSHLTAFMVDLAAVLRPQGKLVTQAVPAKDRERTTGWAGAYDYAALGDVNDLVIVMTYGYGTGVPQSTAPYPWVASTAAYISSQIPAEKVLLGLAWYGYDWNLTKGGVVSLTHAEAVARAQANQATIGFDERTQTPRFTYESEGERHEVWFEDRRSNDAKMALVFRYGLAGAAGWRMGHEDPAVWSSYKESLGFRSWYLAEGSTAPPFDTWVLLQNPNSYPITATLTFMKEDGTVSVHRYPVRASSRLSVYANQLVPNTAFSTRVEATGPVLVERAMYFGSEGHDSPGVNAPNRTWFLPDGSTSDGAHAWVLLMNPNPYAVVARLTFLLERGAPVTQELQLNPTSRLNVFANNYVPNGRFGTVVEAQAPIVAERAGYSERGAHGSPGTPTPANTWYLPEGFTGHQVSIALMNPNLEPSRATLTFMMEGARPITTAIALPPQSRATVMGPTTPANTGYSTLVESDHPIAVERTTFAPGQGSHSSLGATTAARTWFLAEGATTSPFASFVLLQNPNSAPARATVTYMPEQGSALVSTYDLAPNSRFTIPVNQVVPNSAVSVRVDGTLPVVVERAMYFGRGAHASIGISQ